MVNPVRTEDNMSGIQSTETFLLEMKDITKVFPGVRALDHVGFNLRNGEVHALLGENGAGKSTMIKVLAGAYVLDEGKITISGKEVNITNPKIGEDLGIGVIYQEFNLVPYVSVAENIFLGALPTKSRLRYVNWRKLYEEASAVLETLDCHIDPRALVQDLNVAEQQMVEIAKTLSHSAQIIVMDEPTAALGTHEIDRLFRVVEQLRDQGKGIIYVSHRLEEIFAIGDRITVLRDGQYVGTVPVKGISQASLIQMMVGRQIENRFPWEKRNPGKPVLKVNNLTRKGAFQDINFTLYENEILGVAGLLGSGRSELVQAIFGSLPVDSGTLEIRSERILPRSPGIAINRGIGYLPADRKKEGLILCLSVLQNMTIASLSRFVQNRVLRLNKERQVVIQYKEEIGIKTPTLNREVMYLSGGNQQKVMLAKWLCSQSTIILFDEPTRGIDIGAKHEVYRLLIELAKQGKSILMISSEMPEVLGMSDRVIVMRYGKITAELSRGEATERNVLQYMMISNGENL